VVIGSKEPVKVFAKKPAKEGISGDAA